MRITPRDGPEADVAGVAGAAVSSVAIAETLRIPLKNDAATFWREDRPREDRDYPRDYRGPPPHIRDNRGGYNYDRRDYNGGQGRRDEPQRR